MTSDPDSPSAEEGGARLARLQELATLLGVELPPFNGPLVAFNLDDDTGTERPVFLGGDLHAVHPDADERHRHPHDPTLDSATITLTDLENEPLEIPATQGIWCIRVAEELLDPAPYISIFDSQGRLRTWLILPPPRLMIGLGHFWLPAVRPFPGKTAAEGTDPSGPHS